MQTRFEIEDDTKSVINHAVAAKQNLDAARSSLTALIDTTVGELIAERHPSITISGLTADKQKPGVLLGETHAVMLAVQVFPLPEFNEAYAIARGLQGIVKLRELSDGVSESTIGTVIYSRDIPLVSAYGTEYELTIETVAIALTELRRELLGTGIEG